MIANTALVKNSNIGDGTRIWDFANIYGASIGAKCTIGAYVEIQNEVLIGNGVTVSSHSFLCSLVTIENNVFVGHGVMTINDLFPPSRKRTGSDSDWRRTTIKEGATIGSNATLLPVTIGSNSVVAAGSVVTHDVPENVIVAGNPAKIIRHLEVQR